MRGEKLNFDRLIDALQIREQQGLLLDNCMRMEPAVIRQVPLRYRIIALAFVRGMTLEQVQQKLLDNGCPKLYARSPWEATLIFAFSHGLGYGTWRELCAACADDFPKAESPYFRESRITFEELERYVRENSEDQDLATAMHTQVISDALTAGGSDESNLRRILRENASAFSTAREKTRYYFCKYLYYYLSGLIEGYFEDMRRGADHDEALSALLPFKVVTKLRRGKTMPEEEKRRLLHESAISCGEIFDSFNLFFFSYVSLNWVNVLLETYSDINEIPAGARTGLAGAARREYPSLKRITDDRAVIREYIRLTEAEEDVDENPGYGRGRAGEHAVFGYIKGTIDPSRTALLCFLLFFSSARIPAAARLSEERLQIILARCGFALLDPMEDDFDWFVSEYLQSDDPMALLSDVVTESAVRFQQNSFLYRLYNGSVSQSEELRKLI